MTIEDILNVLKRKEHVYHLNGVSDEEILLAEDKLGVKFSDDYKIYLKLFGLLSFESHELTGICESARLNVVDSTLEELADNEFISNDMYLLEQVGVENMTIWQNTKGEVFEVAYKQAPQKICDSLLEYIERD